MFLRFLLFIAHPVQVIVEYLGSGKMIEYGIVFPTVPDNQPHATLPGIIE